MTRPGRRRAAAGDRPERSLGVQPWPSPASGGGWPGYAVLLIHVLHLVAEIPATLAEAARVLRPGGALAATGFPAGPVEGDVFAVLDRLHERLGRLRRDDAPDTLLPLAEAAGFEFVARIDEPGRPVSPGAEADLIEARSQAWTWSIDDAA